MKTASKTKQQTSYWQSAAFHDIVGAPRTDACTVDESLAAPHQTIDALAGVTVLGAPTINVNEIDVTGEGDVVVDRVGEPQVTPTTLPTVVTHDVRVTMPDVIITWHMVKWLPGYMAKPIRALGRMVFAPFTRTAIEDILIIATVGGGPNSQLEIDTVCQHLSRNGTANKAAELYFGKAIPSYSAAVISYDCDGRTFLLVSDFAGSYIYSWPVEDSVHWPDQTKALDADQALESTVDQLPCGPNSAGHRQ